MPIAVPCDANGHDFFGRIFADFGFWLLGGNGLRFNLKTVSQCMLVAHTHSFMMSQRNVIGASVLMPKGSQWLIET